MRIYELGDGNPEVAVVGAIHGDEPCGARAIERLLSEDPPVERPVKLIVANEEALERGVRYVDEDLNRAFPGDANGESHESRLAHDLAREIRGCTTLAIHSTQSFGEPFAVVNSVDAVSRTIAPRLPVVALIETDDYTEGRLIEFPHVIEIEAGFQGTEEAAENAYWLLRAFLAATSALPAPAADDPVRTDDADPVQVFRLRTPIPKPPAENYEVFVRNFERVDAGEVFAAADDERFTAEESFYPVLLSPYGYEDQFGYVADRVGTVE